MSNLWNFLTRQLVAWLSSDSKPLEPESMSLRDWADLPPHHPVRDRAPC